MASPCSSRVAQGLIVASSLGVIALAASYGRAVWADSGSFVFILFGVPLSCTAAALWVERGSATMLAPAVVTVLAVVALAWSLLTALGVGLGLVPPALLLLVAAMVSWLRRLGRDPRSSLTW